MDLTFYLNKFLKVDNIEYYNLDALFKLRDAYSDFLENSKGVDPDFPMIEFGGGKGSKIQGVNKAQVGNNDEMDDPMTSDFLSLTK